jgi:hypothetical protein
MPLPISKASHFVRKNGMAHTLNFQIQVFIKQKFDKHAKG